MTFTSYSQNFEDVVLWRALRHVTSGTYIDIGAQDPELDSVSLAFYKAGWRGIHVEATSAYAAKLRAARPDEIVIEAAVSDAPGPIQFFEIPNSGLSTGKADIAEMHEKAGWSKRSILVPTIRLDGILESTAGREVHWLKIDVEGMEVDVLRSWGDHPARPWILVIEATTPMSQEQSHSEWLPDVLRRGYREVLFDGLSRYFLHEDHEELLSRVEQPANVFDDFTVGCHHFSAATLRGNLKAMERDLGSARSELSELVQQHAAAIEGVRSALEARIASTISRGTLERRELERAHARQLAEIERDNVEARHNFELAMAKERAWFGLQLEAKLASAHDSFAKERTDLHSSLRSVEQDLATSRIRSARLEERCLQLQSQVEAANRAEERLLDERARLQDQVAVLDDQALQAQQALTTQSNDALTRLASARAELDKARATAAELKAAVSAALEGTELALSQPTATWRRVAENMGLLRPEQWRVVLLQRRATASSALVATDDIGMGQAGMLKESGFWGAVGGEQRDPYQRATSLNELLSWHDVDFVRCAYVTILGRQPDPGGEEHYTFAIRQGRSKYQVLWQLRRSDEGRRHDPRIKGLDRTLRRAAWGRNRLFGGVIRWLTGLEGDSAADRQSRRILNELGQVHGALVRITSQATAPAPQISATAASAPIAAMEASPIAAMEASTPEDVRQDNGVSTERWDMSYSGGSIHRLLVRTSYS